jgi:hypothetical protein
MSNLEHSFTPGDEMRSPRQRRLIRAQLTDAHGVNFDIVIRNVSERGLGASTQGSPPLR